MAINKAWRNWIWDHQTQIHLEADSGPPDYKSSALNSRPHHLHCYCYVVVDFVMKMKFCKHDLSTDIVVPELKVGGHTLQERGNSLPSRDRAEPVMKISCF